MPLFMNINKFFVGKLAVMICLPSVFITGSGHNLKKGSFLGLASFSRRFMAVCKLKSLGGTFYPSVLRAQNGCSSSKLMRWDGLCRRPYDGSAKAHAISPVRHIFNRSGVLLREEFGVNNAGEFGRPLIIPGHPKREKMVVAVDVDEVLGSFLPALNKFIANHYSSHHTVSEYYVYEFYKIWNCTWTEAQNRVHEFFKTPYFTSGIDPIPGAHTVLNNVATFCNLFVVTSRQNVIKDQTCDWIEKHYSGLFKEIYFGNHFALDGRRSLPKSELCRSLGAHVLIDDNPEYALDCAEAGIRVLLFDYRNSYPWCKTGSVDSHTLITKVHSWEEVEHHLTSLAIQS